MTVTPYAMMMNDPTAEAMVAWIDQRPGATATPQTLVYGPSGDEATSTPVALPNGAVHHRAVISGQDPGTLCPLSVPAEGLTFPPVRMLPRRLSDDPVRVLVVSDTHCGARTINTPSGFAFIGAETPDAILIPGDSSGSIQEGHQQWTSATAADVHCATIRDYFAQCWSHGQFLPQIAADAGNHWVGNGASDATGENAPNVPTGYVDGQNPPPDANFFDVFHAATRAVEPSGLESWGGPIRHMSIKIGNWLQVFSADVYSNTISSAAGFFSALYSKDPGLFVFMCHNVMFSQGDRNAGDPVIHNGLRNAFFRQIAEAENCKFSFGGNMHLDTITKPLSWHQDNPGAPSVALGEGWAAPAAAGEWRNFVEFGEGCLGNRGLQASPLVPSGMWDRLEQAPLNFYRLTFTRGRVVVENRNQSGVAATREFHFPAAERADGVLARAYRPGGAPVYPRGAA